MDVGSTKHGSYGVGGSFLSVTPSIFVCLGGGGGVGSFMRGWFGGPGRVCGFTGREEGVSEYMARKERSWALAGEAADFVGKKPAGKDNCQVNSRDFKSCATHLGPLFENFSYFLKFSTSEARHLELVV